MSQTTMPPLQPHVDPAAAPHVAPIVAVPVAVPVLPPAPAGAKPAPDPDDNPDMAKRRLAASIGAQVVLDPSDPVAIAARGGASGTMMGNIVARNDALVARAGDPMPVMEIKVRDPILDPMSDAALAAHEALPDADKPKV